MAKRAKKEPQIAYTVEVPVPQDLVEEFRDGILEQICDMVGMYNGKEREAVAEAIATHEGIEKLIRDEITFCLTTDVGYELDKYIEWKDIQKVLKPELDLWETEKRAAEEAAERELEEKRQKAMAEAKIKGQTLIVSKSNAMKAVRLLAAAGIKAQVDS